MSEKTTSGASARTDSPTGVPAGAGRTAAIALWVLVGAALVYGVGETAVRVAALFG